jgi:hypothetical protein
MDTQVRTPQLVFMQPQRLIVPLFQRPYVWNQENQWEPLWKDVIRVANAVVGSQSPASGQAVGEGRDLFAQRFAGGGDRVDHVQGDVHGFEARR